MIRNALTKDGGRLDAFFEKVNRVSLDAVAKFGNSAQLRSIFFFNFFIP